MKMRIFAVLCLFLAILGWLFCQNSSAAEKESAEALLLDAFKAEKAGGDQARVRQKFEAVLQADPENYYALVKLGAMKMSEQGATPDLSAINYFLRAAVAMPNNPEAYLYLAQLHYRTGYITEGDSYLRMCEGINRNLVYDGICLLGWRYEDTGNHFAAIMTYAPAALSPDSRFMGDPFLVTRLYQAAQMSRKPYDWVYEVTRIMFREMSQPLIEVVNDNVSKAFTRNPRLEAFYTRKDAASLVLRDVIISELKPYVSLMDKVPERYDRPSQLYKFLFCDPEKLERARIADPYEAFAAASPGTAKERERVLTALRTIRDQALKEAASGANDEEKARRLYLWLKKNVLKEYSALDGYSAKSIVDKQKFDAVSGTVLYVLLARDAKLDVKASFVPGRVFAVMDRENQIRIDLAVEAGVGFNIKVDATDKFRGRDPSLDGTGLEHLGAIANPMELVAATFVDSAVKRLDSLAVDRYEQLFRRVLREELGLDDTGQTEVIEGLRGPGSARVASSNGTLNLTLDSRQFRDLVRKMASLDMLFRQNLIARYDEGVAFLKTARQLAPFDARFRLAMGDLITTAAATEYHAADAGMVDRSARKALAFLAATEANLPSMLIAAASARGQQTRPGPRGAASEQEAKINLEERQNWPAESKAWMAALARVTASLKQHPCDERLRGVLAAIYARGMAMAERNQDSRAIDEIRRIADIYLQ